MLTNPKLDRRGLRSFGLVTGCTVGGLFGLMVPWFFEHRIPLWPWAAAAVLVSLAAAAPTLLRPVYSAWMAFGLLMGRITTPLLLGAIFLLVVTPIARLRALSGRDRMQRDFRVDVDSYRIASKPTTAKDLERPF